MRINSLGDRVQSKQKGIDLSRNGVYFCVITSYKLYI